MAHKPMKRAPTPEEARRGIYIDFEGFAEKRDGTIPPPVLIGILCEDEFTQFVFDERLSPAATAKGISMASMEDVILKAVVRAEEEKRAIFAYSVRELEALGEYGELQGRMRSRYRNGLKIARRWLERCFPNEATKDRKGKRRWRNKAYRTKNAGEWSLINFLKFIAYPLPANLGVAKTTSRLRAVIDMLPKRANDYDRLTPVVKAKWTKVLKHNRHDCFGLMELMVRVSRGC